MPDRPIGRYAEVTIFTSWHFAAEFAVEASDGFAVLTGGCVIAHRASRESVMTAGKLDFPFEEAESDRDPA